jgi:uncharacterized protein YciI
MPNNLVHLLFLHYTGSEQDAEPFVVGHAEYLNRHHHAGVFVLSGQTEPTSVGGAIVAVGVDRADVEAITEEDPFVAGGVGRYEIVTINAGRVHPMLAALVESDPVRG